jgi:RNA polymerase sigma-70 factor (ECF subfamily)
METMIEASVLEGCGVESAEAGLARLFDTHHQRLFRLARRLSTSRDDALDLVQETFLRIAASSRPVPTGRAEEEAWLVRVLVNLARDRWRRAKVRTRAGERADGGRFGANPEAAYVARLAVETALDCLDPRRRAVVVLHELEEQDVSAIARLLRISPVTVRWHLARARKQLAAVLLSS